MRSVLGQFDFNKLSSLHVLDLYCIATGDVQSIIVKLTTQF